MGLMSKPSFASVWDEIPDDIIFHVFTFLPASSLLQAAQVCRCWHRVSRDELLWKDIFYRHHKIHRHITMAPGQLSWLLEYKRLYYHTPAVESEVIRQHTDQVLHVSFSHNGKMFATSSKDGFIKVWNTSYPVSLKFKENMKRYTWKYTQFSQFNESDTLLLVSGVHFGSNSTSGEIAVFSLQGQFELQARVINKPYDVFGTWYNDTHLISGTLHWTGQLQSCSVLWINKAFQDTDNEHESVVMRLYKLKNINASSVRTVFVATYREVTDDSMKRSKRVQANFLKDDDESSSKYPRKNNKRKIGNIEYDQEYRDAEKSCNDYAVSQEQNQSDSSNSNVRSKTGGCENLAGQNATSSVLNLSHNSSSVRNSDFSVDCDNDFKPVLDILAEKTTKCISLTSDTVETRPPSYSTTVDQSVADENNSSGSASHCTCNSECSCHGGMYLDGASFGGPVQSNFFSSFDHKVALDERNPESQLHSGDPSITFPEFLGSEPINRKGKIVEKFLIFTQGSQTYTPHQIGIKRIKPLEKIEDDEHAANVLPDIEFNSPALESVQYDHIDKVIDMHGHIIGLALSPDHRYLYVNCRPWPKDYDIQNPLQPPPIAQEIDIHVIDLLRLTEVGTMYRAHKAYTPNDECFFIFLDVSQKYVASGAEDKHGYIWDRHYGVCLKRFQHDDVVNCVAFNPADSEILVTVSDDCTIKIWRSLNREKNKFAGFF